MTTLLEEAFNLARRLPAEAQDRLASRIIAELTEDDDFDRRIAATVERLDWLIEEGKAAYEAGQTEEVVPERL